MCLLLINVLQSKGPVRRRRFVGEAEEGFAAEAGARDGAVRDGAVLVGAAVGVGGGDAPEEVALAACAGAAHRALGLVADEELERLAGGGAAGGRGACRGVLEEAARHGK